MITLIIVIAMLAVVVFSIAISPDEYGKDLLRELNGKLVERLFVFSLLAENITEKDITDLTQPAIKRDPKYRKAIEALEARYLGYIQKGKD